MKVNFEASLPDDDILGDCMEDNNSVKVLRQKRFFRLQDLTRHIPKLSDMDYDIKSFTNLQPGKDRATSGLIQIYIQQKLTHYTEDPNFQLCSNSRYTIP